MRVSASLKKPRHSQLCTPSLLPSLPSLPPSPPSLTYPISPLRSFVQHILGTSSCPSSPIHTLRPSPHASPTSSTTAAIVMVVVVVVVAVAPAALVRPSIPLALLLRLLLLLGVGLAAHGGGIHVSRSR